MEFIDALRGIAILGVILTHVASAVEITGPVRYILNLGGFGVQIFFVVSAFTIFLTYRTSLRVEDAPVRNFFIKRLLRIVPVFWAGIIIYTLIYGLDSRGWQNGPEVWHFITFITLTNVFVPHASSSVVPGGWSISVEVMFYFIVPFLFVTIDNMKKSIIFTTISMAAGALSLYYFPRYFSELFGGYSEAREFWYRLPIVQLGCFGCGMILYFALSDTNIKKFLNRSYTGIIAVLISFMMVSIVIISGGVIKQYIISMVALLLGLALSQNPYRIIVNPFMITLGKISFSAYLIHFIIIQMVIKYIPIHMDVLERTVYVSIFTLIITFALAWISWRYYEMVWTRMARGLIFHLEARQERA